MGESVLVVSPHFDDAVLSLAGVLAMRVRAGDRVEVVTAFGGVPDDATSASEWDRSCGFASAAQAARARQAEDHRALAAVGADLLHLGDLDGPYRTGQAAAALTAFLAARGRDYVEAYVPAALGGHPDHVAARDAALGALPDTVRTSLYADLPYASQSSVWMTSERGAALDPAWERDDLPAVRARFTLGPPRVHTLDAATWAVKVTAVHAYGSQLAALGAWVGTLHALGGPLGRELLWPLERRTEPAGVMAPSVIR